MVSQRTIRGLRFGFVLCMCVGVLFLLGVEPGEDPVSVSRRAPFVRTAAAGDFKPASLTWQIETIDASTGTVYFGNSLALDSSGVPCVAYYDPGTTNLVYACRTGGSWQYDTADSSGNVGKYTSLALDVNDHPHISYQDDLGGDTELKYAHYNGSSWSATTVDGGLYTGAFTSLALDPMGDPWITYYRGGNCSVDEDTYCNLRYAYYDGSWTTMRLHYSTNDVGRSSSLAFDSAGHPHVSYYNAGESDLRYIHLDWDIRDIADGAGTTGADTSLAIDSYDDPHIAYVGQGELRYAHGTVDFINNAWDATWVTATVDSGSSARATSLALDASDNPHIAYYLDGELRYAYRDGTTWHVETVAATGGIDGNEGLSLALDRLGSPHITFYTSTGLKYAYVEPTHVYLPLVASGYPPPPQRYALIIGIADYLYDDDPPLPGCFFDDLPYPDNDARAMEALLLNQGFAASNVRTLIDADATKANIQDAITNWLAPNANPNDQVLIFYHGHGWQYSDVAPYDEADGVDELLVPHEWACDADTAITDDELETWLDTVNSQHMVLFIDSCFSGGMIGAQAAEDAGCHGRCVPPPPWVEIKPTADTVQPLDVDKAGRLVLTAGKEDAESYECDSLQSGVFSYYLRQALQAGAADTHDGNGWISGEEAYEYLKPRVEDEMCYQPWFQFPQISDGIPGEEDITSLSR